MSEIKDFIEDWIVVRTVVGKQVTRIKQGHLVMEGSLSEPEALRTVGRLERLQAELNALLKDHASAKVS